jgi:ribA/ribD-fused uncharacterized protein
VNLPTRIDSFTGPWAFLSNFAPGEVQLWVTADGMVYAHEVPDAVIEVYASVEHAYQAAKTLNAAVREKFRFAGVTPGRAKKMGRSLKLRPDWEEIKVGLMRDLLMQKFRASILKRKLLSTFQAELIEGNYWHDTFWGVCMGKCDFPHAPLGENWLGRLLMEVRQFYGLGTLEPMCKHGKTKRQECDLCAGGFDNASPQIMEDEDVS